MCGIAGFYDSGIRADQAQSTIRKMLQSMSHRGPDFSGSWLELPICLGHNRLKIIDLSDGANQPMIYKDCVITYNGEVYNYIELRKNLEELGHRFSTSSDTEVILAAYKEWGEDCVNHFIGMWAFAIWDKTQKKLFCSRDRFGIKPFYYIQANGSFYFGSEYRPLKQTSVFTKDINIEQVSRGIQLGWIFFEDQTYFKSIKRLPPASNIVFQNGEIKIYKYWDINITKSSTLSLKEKSDAFREMFLESIKLHIRSDVPIGACLSGGIDSSSIVSAFAHLYPEQKIKTFTIYYEGKDEVDERPWAQEVINKYPNIEPFYCTPDKNKIAELFESSSNASEIPLPGSSPISQYVLMQKAAQEGVKVMLDGQGSDEYLAGYLHSFDKLVGSLIQRLNIYKAYTALKDLSTNNDQSMKKVLFVFLKSLLTTIFDERDIYNIEYEYKIKNIFTERPKLFLDSISNRGIDRFKESLYNLIFTSSLPALLQYEDRNSMAFSIESRVPFLDHRLVEYSFCLKDEDKIYKGITKFLLRLSLQEILPEKIFTRKDKKAFATPESNWLRNELKELLEINFSQLDFINKSLVQNIIKDFKNGDNSNDKLVWRLASLNHWVSRNI